MSTFLSKAACSATVPLLLVFTLAACGGKQDDAPSAETGNKEETQSAAPIPQEQYTSPDANIEQPNFEVPPDLFIFIPEQKSPEQQIAELAIQAAFLIETGHITAAALSTSYETIVPRELAAAKNAVFFDVDEAGHCTTTGVTKPEEISEDAICFSSTVNVMSEVLPDNMKSNRVYECVTPNSINLRIELNKEGLTTLKTMYTEMATTMPLFESEFKGVVQDAELGMAMVEYSAQTLNDDIAEKHPNFTPTDTIKQCKSSETKGTFDNGLHPTAKDLII